MKKISKVLAILLVAALVTTVFIGAGAAALTDTKIKMEANGDTVNGMLVPGETVKATVSFTTNIKNLAVGDTLLIETGFETPWQADVTIEGDTLTFTDTITSKRPTMDCINFMNVGSNATITVVCSGTIPSSAKGNPIIPLTVTMNAANSSASGSVSTQTVDVYNTTNLEKDKSTVSQAIATLNQRIAKFNTPDVVALGISFSYPERYLSNAENCLVQAQRSGVSDYTASTYIIEAKKQVENAEKAINELTLQVAQAKLNQVESLMNDLKGLNIDVDNISTKYTVYKSTLTGFNSSTESSKVDELITNIQALYDEAYNKLNPSASGSSSAELPSWLPWVIIGGIAAIVIAIVIILVVRRHKKNSWDELG